MGLNVKHTVKQLSCNGEIVRFNFRNKTESPEVFQVLDTRKLYRQIQSNFNDWLSQHGIRFLEKVQPTASINFVGNLDLYESVLVYDLAMKDETSFRSHPILSMEFEVKEDAIEVISQETYGVYIVNPTSILRKKLIKQGFFLI